MVSTAWRRVVFTLAIFWCTMFDSTLIYNEKILESFNESLSSPHATVFVIGEQTAYVRKRNVANMSKPNQRSCTAREQYTAIRCQHRAHANLQT
jgi:hypothetical protein